MLLTTLRSFAPWSTEALTVWVAILSGKELACQHFREGASSGRMRSRGLLRWSSVVMKCKRKNREKVGIASRGRTVRERGAVWVYFYRDRPTDSNMRKFQPGGVRDKREMGGHSLRYRTRKHPYCSPRIRCICPSPFMCQDHSLSAEQQKSPYSSRGGGERSGRLSTNNCARWNNTYAGN